MPHNFAEEKPLCAADPGEALLVWSMRHWVQSVRAGLDPRDLIRRGFASIDAEEASAAFDAIMMMTLHESTCRRDVRCLNAPTIGAGERDRVDAVGLWQRGQGAAAGRVLSGWLPAEIIGQALQKLSLLARGFTDAGMRLPTVDREEVDALPPMPSAALH